MYPYVTLSLTVLTALLKQADATLAVHSLALQLDEPPHLQSLSENTSGFI